MSFRKIIVILSILSIVLLLVFNRDKIGRGEHYVVDNLSGDNIEGSLRKALESKEKRYVTFNVEGVIDLKDKPIIIEHPYLTVSGETSSGKGIVLRNSGIIIKTHDVTIKGLKFRVGSTKEGASPSSRDNISMSGSYNCGAESGKCDVYNIIIDHCSVSWSVDENIGIWGGAHDITISNSIISNALDCSIHPDGCHSMGILIGPKSKNISIHNNLIASNAERNPVIYHGNSVDFYNNIVFDWRNQGISAGGCKYKPEHSGEIMVAGNVFIVAAAKSIGVDKVQKPIHISGCWRDAKVSVVSNIFVDDTGRYVDSKQILRNEPSIELTPLSNPPEGFVALNLANVDVFMQELLATVGAQHKERDLVDQSILKSVETRTSNIINNEK